MPPPPSVTPSPHRFVIRREAAARKPTQEHNPSKNIPQFNTTPQFHFSATRRQAGTQSYSATTPSASRGLTAASRTTKEEDQDVIDASSDDEDSVHDSIETDTSELALEYEPVTADADDGYEIEARTAKRKHFSSPPAEERYNDEEVDTHHHGSFSSSLPTLLSPPSAPRRAIPAAASRFLIHAPPSTPSAANQSTFRKPPPFRPPDPADLTQSHRDPLPEHFSPHRKGRRCILGGTVAELQGWLLNIQSTIPLHAGQARRDDSWLMKIVVDEVSGSGATGMTLVNGRQVHIGYGARAVDDLGAVRIILAGEGQGIGLQKGLACEVGKTVGVNKPFWELSLGGIKWGVGVDWKVLPDG